MEEVNFIPYRVVRGGVESSLGWAVPHPSRVLIRLNLDTPVPEEQLTDALLKQLERAPNQFALLARGEHA